MSGNDSDFEEMMRQLGVRPMSGKGSASTPSQPDHDITEEERRLFLQAMDALDGRGVDRREKVEPDLDLPEPEIDDIDEADRALFLKAVELMSVEALDEDKPMPPKSGDAGLVKLKLPKKTKVFWDDSIDLHGKTVEEAVARVASFVPRCYAENDRVIAVITGKGKHSEGGVGVLRPAVENWIHLCGRRYVRTYAQAPPAYGGHGVLLLYLNHT